MKRLSVTQERVLLRASTRKFIDFYDVVRNTGGNGKTLASLCDAGLLVKTSYPDGSNDWSITSSGRAQVERLRGLAEHPMEKQ